MSCQIVHLFQSNCSSKMKVAACTLLPAIALVCLALTLPVPSFAQAVTLTPEIYTLAGTGTQGYSGDGGPAISAEMNNPYGVALDGGDDLYLVDNQNCVVRVVSALTSTITTVAGVDPNPSTHCGYSGDGGAATSAELNLPQGIAVDKAGNIYIADTVNQRIRKVTASTGIITTVAGNGSEGFSGDDGPATSAELNFPGGVAVNSAGDLFIADTTNQRIRVVGTAGIISTYAGNGTRGFGGDGGPATSAELYNPGGVSLKPNTVLIADTGNQRIRAVNASSGDIGTVAGNGTAGYGGDGGPATSAELNYPYSVSVDVEGNIYVADHFNQRVREVIVATSSISTVAGNGTGGYGGDGGPATSAELNQPDGVIVDLNNNIFIADTSNNRIRKVVSSTAPILFPDTIVLSSSPVQNALLSINSSLTISGISVPQSAGGSFEFSVGTITGCVVNGSTVNSAGSICVVPLTFTPAYSGLRREPLVVQTSLGTFQFGLEGEGVGPQVVVLPAVISTVAGNGTQGNSGDGGPATSAELNHPGGIAVADSGNAYIADTGNCVVRQVTGSSGVISTIAGTGTCGYSGDGGAATAAKLNGPSTIGLDAAGNLYIADKANNRIRELNTASGIITTVAGNGTAGFSGDDGPATSAELNGPSAAHLDSLGNLYIAD
ncbi:MAG: hypothetical protein ABSD20_20120, partial [Terriglobales bacterium]